MSSRERRTMCPTGDCLKAVNQYFERVACTGSTRKVTTYSQPVRTICITR
jgi:hypothetical protein